MNSISLCECLERVGLKFGTLCSKDSKEKAINYQQFTGKLENRITVATSAYFQACDINEAAHIIFISDIKRAPHTVFTVNQLIQAMGRCRPGILSTVFFVKCRTDSSIQFKPYREHLQDIRDLAHVYLGAAEAALLDVQRQTDTPQDHDIPNICDAYRTCRFRRKLLWHQDDIERFAINWMNLDGEALDRYAIQHYIGPQQLKTYLQIDPRINITSIAECTPATKIDDSLVYPTDNTAEEKLQKIIEFYNESGPMAMPIPAAWIRMKNLDSTDNETKEMMILCERAGQLNLLPALLKTKGKKQLMQRLENKMIGEESMSANIHLQQDIKYSFKPKFYTSRYIKQTLQKQFRKHGVSRTAKSTDIERFCEAIPATKKENGVIKHGYFIC